MNQPFWIGNKGSEIDKTFRENLMLWANGKSTREEAMAACDEMRDKILKDEVSPTKVVGNVEETFTEMETGLYFAELFRQEMGADVGLCLSNSRESGINFKLYAGEIQYGGTGGLDFYLERNFLNHVTDDGTKQGQLLLMTLTGEQLLDVLNEPPSVRELYQDGYYVVSGLTVTFAPWAGAGKRYVSVKEADGSELNPDGDYTVAFWKDSVLENLVQEIQASSKKMAAELLSGDLAAKGPISPSSDRLFHLDWKLIQK